MKLPFLSPDRFAALLLDGLEEKSRRYCAHAKTHGGDSQFCDTCWWRWRALEHSSDAAIRTGKLLKTLGRMDRRSYGMWREGFRDYHFWCQASLRRPHAHLAVDNVPSRLASLLPSPSAELAKRDQRQWNKGARRYFRSIIDAVRGDSPAVRESALKFVDTWSWRDQLDYHVVNFLSDRGLDSEYWIPVNQVVRQFDCAEGRRCIALILRVGAYWGLVGKRFGAFFRCLAGKTGEHREGLIRDFLQKDIHARPQAVMDHAISTNDARLKKDVVRAYVQLEPSASFRTIADVFGVSAGAAYGLAKSVRNGGWPTSAANIHADFEAVVAKDRELNALLGRLPAADRRRAAILKAINPSGDTKLLLQELEERQDLS